MREVKILPVSARGIREKPPRWSKRWPLALFFILSGCAGQNYEPEIRRLAKKIGALQTRQSEADRQLQALNDQLLVTKSHLRALKSAGRKVKEVIPADLEVVTLQPAKKEHAVSPDLPPVNIVIDGSKTEIQDSATVSSQTKASFRPSLPDSSFHDGLLHYRSGHYGKAYEALAEFVRNHPNSVKIDKAYYWMGECLVAKGDFVGASRHYHFIIKNHPASTIVPDALYKMGIAHTKGGQVDKAKQAFRDLAVSFPRSPFAELARSRLQGEH